MELVVFVLQLTTCNKQHVTTRHIFFCFHFFRLSLRLKNLLYGSRKSGWRHTAQKATPSKTNKSRRRAERASELACVAVAGRRKANTSNPDHRRYIFILVTMSVVRMVRLRVPAGQAKPGPAIGQVREIESFHRVTCWGL